MGCSNRQLCEYLQTQEPPFDDHMPKETGEVAECDVQVKIGTPLTPAVYPSAQVYVIVEPIVLVKEGVLCVFDGWVGGVGQ